MNNVNVNKSDSIKIIKNFIQDLSFENPQNINENTSVNNNNNDINVNMNVVYKPYNNNFFSLNLKYSIDASSKNNNQQLLTEKGIKFLFPFAKEIIEDITRKGGSVPILLNEVNFNLKRD